MNREVTFTMKDLIRQGVLSKLVAGESTVAEAGAKRAQGSPSSQGLQSSPPAVLRFPFYPSWSARSWTQAI